MRIASQTVKTKIRYGLLGGILALGLFLLLGIPTALIPTGFFTRMISATIADYAILLATSVLAGAYISYSIYVKRVVEDRGDYAAFGGVFAGVFGFGCPICNVALASLFGSAAILTFFEPYRNYLGALMIGLFVLAFYVKVKRCENCKPKTNDRAF